MSLSNSKHHQICYILANLSQIRKKNLRKCHIRNQPLPIATALNFKSQPIFIGCIER